MGPDALPCVFDAAFDIGLVKRLVPLERRVFAADRIDEDEEDEEDE
ncbi:MAG: hypothetical protein ACT4OZ_06075 [Gemmatimonadota bacterium]